VGCRWWLGNAVDAQLTTGIDSICIGRAVVEAVDVFQTEGHREETVGTIEPDRTRATIFVTRLGP